MLSNQVTYIQQWLESVGLSFRGQVISSEIKLSLNNHSTVIIRTDSCAKSLDMVVTTEANPQPSQCKPTSPSQSSSGFSQSTSKRFQPIYDGTFGPMINYNEWGSLLRSLEESGGSLEGVTIHLLKGKELRITLKDPSPT